MNKVTDWEITIPSIPNFGTRKMDKATKTTKANAEIMVLYSIFPTADNKFP